ELENSLASQAIDEAQFAQLKLELERNLLDDEASLHALQKKSSQYLGVNLVLGFCALMLIGGVFFYQHHSSSEDVYIQTLQQEKLQQDYQDMLQNRDPNPARVQQLIVEFEDRLKDKPDNIQYLFLLARAQMEVGNFAEAAKAYQRVLTLDSQSAMIMAELAQAIFLRDGNKITPPVADLAKGAVTLEPKNTMALGLLGIDAYNRKDYPTAIKYWQKTVDISGPDSQGGRALSAGIEKAKQSFIAEGGKLEDLVAKSAYAVKVAVSLGAKVKAKPDQTLFVYARAWQGSPMPLAIARIKVSDLPTTIQLDETMAMSPASSLANAGDIEVIARISPSGSAKAEVGDWLAKQGPISMKAIPEKIDLQINEQITANEVKP
ncbi:MAG TPA: tetratricopeptide repeat protein, partial [Cellvibrio sp.]|nr:tetratricopeptide repeat protein [Cellvibrio sp.]